MKNKLLLLALPALLFIASCTKQPAACFTASKTTVELDELVTFTSCATDGSSYEWDFADGTKAEGENASHKWTKPGVYLVQLKVLSKDKKKVDRYSAAITVKGYTRYLTKVVLKSLETKKPDGSDWDTPSPIPGVTINPEPDVLVRLRLTAGGWDYNTANKGDIKTSDLPYTWNLTQQNIYMYTDSWTVELRDDDVINSELMKAFTVSNPATAGADGKIALTDGNYQLELYYENR